MIFIIDKNEILRYLGYKGQKIKKDLDSIIDEQIKKCEEISRPKYVYKVYDIKKEDIGIKILDSNLFIYGKSIQKHLEKSDKCAIFAATLGVQIDNEIRVLQKVDLTSAIILDAASSALIEKICDKVEDEILSIAKEEGRGINFRFSPGFGDFSLDYQRKILLMLDAQRKIGLTATESNILIPRKSVTALIGFI